MMVFLRAPRAALTALLLVAALFTALAGAPAIAQKRAHGVKAPSLSALTAQGFEIKAGLRDALVLQKGAAVYWCVLHLANTAPMSYQSACYAVR